MMGCHRYLILTKRLNVQKLVCVLCSDHGLDKWDVEHFLDNLIHALTIYFIPYNGGITVCLLEFYERFAHTCIRMAGEGR